MTVPIIIEKVFAKVKIGNIEFGTPREGTKPNYILSFNINSSRGQPIAQCRCQLVYDVSGGGLSFGSNTGLGTKITIYGSDTVSGDDDDSSANIQLFTGYITHVSQEPHWESAGKVILNISAEDVLTRLKNQKVSRRFKIVDEAYAVITGGERHSEGPLAAKLAMVDIEQMPASVTQGVLQNSPLQKTPELLGGLSQAGFAAAERNPIPTGSKEQSIPTPNPDYSNYKFKPDSVYASSGDVIIAQVIHKTTNMVIDVKSLDNIVGVEGKGLLFCIPCLTSTNPSTGEASPVTDKEQCVVQLGQKESYPISVRLGMEGRDDFSGFEITVTSDYPAVLTFVHPMDGQQARLTIMPVPIHDHRTMSRGGPAVGSYDVFQV